MGQYMKPEMKYEVDVYQTMDEENASQTSQDSDHEPG